MTYLDDYKKRLEANGSTVGESFANYTKDLINKTFADSPFYQVVPINNVNTGVRVLSTKFSHVKNLLFKPEVVLNKGSYVGLDGATWLMIDFSNDGIYSKSVVQRCNDVLKWKNSSGTIKEYKCVATDSAISNTSFDLENQQQVSVTLPIGELNVFVQLNNDTSTITEKQRFIIGNRPYKVVGINNVNDVFNGVGMLKISMKLDTIATGDDFTNDIAVNTSISSAPSGGGKLW